MSEFTKELERRIDSGFMTEPQDIRRMLKHNQKDGRNFGTWMYSYMDSWELMNVLYMMYKAALNEANDLGTIKSIATAVIGNKASNFKAARMEDTTSVLYRSIGSLNGCKSHEALAEVLRAVQRYVNMIFYAVDHALPWDAMSKEYDRLMADFVPLDRIDAVDVSDQ